MGKILSQVHTQAPIAMIFFFKKRYNVLISQAKLTGFALCTQLLSCCELAKKIDTTLLFIQEPYI